MMKHQETQAVTMLRSSQPTIHKQNSTCPSLIVCLHITRLPYFNVISRHIYNGDNKNSNTTTYFMANPQPCPALTDDALLQTSIPDSQGIAEQAQQDKAREGELIPDVSPHVFLERALNHGRYLERVPRVIDETSPAPRQRNRLWNDLEQTGQELERGRSETGLKGTMHIRTLECHLGIHMIIIWVVGQKIERFIDISIEYKPSHHLWVHFDMQV